MLRHDREYKEMLKRLDSEQRSLQAQINNLAQLGLPTEQIEQALAPAISYCEQLRQEVQYYEKIKLGEFEEIRNLEGLGKTLIAIRIALGISQKELAQKLHVSEGQISKDERHEYHGVTLEKAQRILAALGVTLTTKVEYPSPQPPLPKQTPSPDN